MGARSRRRTLRARARHHAGRRAVRASPSVERDRAVARASGVGRAPGGGTVKPARAADRRNIDLGPGKEFDMVRALLAEWGKTAQRIGDDAAVLEVPAGERLVGTTDTSVEGVHFHREWLNYFEIGYRATAASLSDLAAMGARPIGVLIALTLPEGDRAEARELATGIREGAFASMCPIVGG